MHIFFSDAYDALTGVGMFSGAHVKEDCFLELIRIIKPGRDEFRILQIDDYMQKKRKCSALAMELCLFASHS